MRMFQTARHELHAQPDGRTGRLRHVTRLRTHRRFVAHALGACLFVLAGCGTTDEVAGDPAISVAARPSNPDAPTYATCQDLAKVFNARDENHLSYLRSVTMRFRSVNHSGSQFRRKRPLLDTTERNAGLRAGRCVAAHVDRRRRGGPFGSPARPQRSDVGRVSDGAGCCAFHGEPCRESDRGGQGSPGRAKPPQHGRSGETGLMSPRMSEHAFKGSAELVGLVEVTRWQVVQH